MVNSTLQRKALTKVTSSCLSQARSKNVVDQELILRIATSLKAMDAFRDYNFEFDPAGIKSEIGKKIEESFAFAFKTEDRENSSSYSKEEFYKELDKQLSSSWDDLIKKQEQLSRDLDLLKQQQEEFFRKQEEKQKQQEKSFSEKMSKQNSEINPQTSITCNANPGKTARNAKYNQALSKGVQYYVKKEEEKIAVEQEGEHLVLEGNLLLFKMGVGFSKFLIGKLWQGLKTGGGFVKKGGKLIFKGGKLIFKGGKFIFKRKKSVETEIPCEKISPLASRENFPEGKFSSVPKVSTRQASQATTPTSGPAEVSSAATEIHQTSSQIPMPLNIIKPMNTTLFPQRVLLLQNPNGNAKVNSSGNLNTLFSPFIVATLVIFSFFYVYRVTQNFYVSRVTQNFYVSRFTQNFYVSRFTQNFFPSIFEMQTKAKKKRKKIKLNFTFKIYIRSSHIFFRQLYFDNTPLFYFNDKGDYVPLGYVTTIHGTKIREKKQFLLKKIFICIKPYKLFKIKKKKKKSKFYESCSRGADRSGYARDPP